MKTKILFSAVMLAGSMIACGASDDRGDEKTATAGAEQDLVGTRRHNNTPDCVFTGHGCSLNPDDCEWPESYFDESIWFDVWPDQLQVRTMALDPSKGADARRGDYSALVMLGVDRRGVIHVEADLARRPTPQIVADGAERFRRFGPDVFGVEANQFQDLLAGPHPPQPLNASHFLYIG